MLKLGDVVFVQNKGVCRVDAMDKKDVLGNGMKDYYVMKPVSENNNMTIYVPTDTKLKIRKLSTKEKALKILNEFANLEGVEIKNEEERFKKYNELSQEGELEGWAKLLKTLFERKKQFAKKQFAIQEQKYINTLLPCLISELSYVLKKDEREIKDTISNAMEVTL